jgi:hypothetical protein
VAEDARGRDGAVLDFFDVRRADAANGDFDEEFVRADARDGDGFEAEVVDAAINDGAHGFGDGGHAGHLAIDEPQMKHGFFRHEVAARSLAATKGIQPRMDTDEHGFCQKQTAESAKVKNRNVSCAEDYHLQFQSV